jgi:DNA-binding MarR family transcriptional regulator
MPDVTVEREPQALVAEVKPLDAVRIVDEQALMGFWVNLVQTASVLRARLAEQLEIECHLAPEEAELLMRLAAAPEARLKMAEVSDLLLVSKSGVTRMVDRLIARDLVERAACPTDRRVVYAAITERGKTLLIQAVPAFVESLMAALAPHTEPAELELVRDKLRKILVGNGAWSAERCEAAFLDAVSSSAVR